MLARTCRPPAQWRALGRKKVDDGAILVVAKQGRAMRAAFARSDYESGAVDGIEAVARHLAAHFPAHGSGTNELPDEAVVL